MFGALLLGGDGGPVAGSAGGPVAGSAGVLLFFRCGGGVEGSAGATGGGAVAGSAGGSTGGGALTGSGGAPPIQRASFAERFLSTTAPGGSTHVVRRFGTL